MITTTAVVFLGFIFPTCGYLWTQVTPTIRTRFSKVGGKKKEGGAVM